MMASFYRNIRLIILVVFLIVAWGIASFQALPRQEDPELIARTAVVKTAYPGASAERVESLVTKVLESEIAEIEAVKTISSDSRVGFSTISVELADKITNAQPIWSKVRNEMDEAKTEFPSGASDPSLEEVEIKAYTLIPALKWTQDQEPNYAIMRRYAEELAVTMRGLPGTDEVELFGAPKEEILVEVDASELVAVGLSPQVLANRIDLSDAKVSAGELHNSERNLALEVNSELKTLEQIRQIPIQNSQEGQFTRLGDIATVDRGISQPPQKLALVGEEPAIALGVLMKSGKRIDQYVQTVRQQLDAFRQRLPSGIELDVIFDQSVYVEDRIQSLMANLLFAAILVIAVVFVAMGWRSAFVVGVALPLTVCAVLGWMSALDMAVHQMSVTGLIIALGLLIDNAIVVVNEIDMKLKEGIKPAQAVTKTVNYLKVPLFASTLTTVLTFLPIALLPGGAGEFVGSISVSVILALISSLAISLVVVASIAGRLLASSHAHTLPPQGHFSSRKERTAFKRAHAWWNQGLSWPRLARAYRWTLERITSKPLLAVVLTFAIPITGFAVAGNLDRQFFPLVNRNQFQIEVEFAPETAIAQTKEKTRRMGDKLRQYSPVESVHWFVGESAPKFYYNITGSHQNQAHYAEAMVNLRSGEGVQQLVRTVQQDLSNNFPEARVLVQQLGQGPPYDAPVEMRIYGPNLQELRRLGSQAREILASVPNVVHVRDDLSEYRPKLGFEVDEEKVQRAGLDNTAIAQQLQAYLTGTIGGSILESTENLPVRVRLKNRDRANLDEIASLNLRSPTTSNNQFNPNSALGEFRLMPQRANIARRNEQRVNTVQGFITAGVLPSTVLADFQAALDKQNFQLPSGYRYEFGGEQEESNKAVGNLLLYVPLLVLVMTAALVISLNSFRQAAIIAAIAVGSVGLALFALWVFDSILGFMAIVGSMGLVGIAINDSIVVLSALNEDKRARSGDPKAIREVVVKSTRHVLTTTVTTMMGFVPLLLEGDPFWRPLAIAIAGGIAGSSLLALYFVPAAYLALMYRLPRILRKKPTKISRQAST